LASGTITLPIKETLVNDLAGSGFIAQQRHIVLVGGTGTGKTHLAIAIAEAESALAPAAGSTSVRPPLSGVVIPT
jgi:hypothetical protein